MSRTLGYIVAFVDSEGAISGIATSSIAGFRDAHLSRRDLRAKWPEPARGELQVVRVEGVVRPSRSRGAPLPRAAEPELGAVPTQADLRRARALLNQLVTVAPGCSTVAYDLDAETIARFHSCAWDTKGASK